MDGFQKNIAYVSAILAPLTLALPMAVQAQFLTQVSGLFNIFVGLMLTAAILIYGGSFLMWITRLGTWPTYRTEATKLMEWSVVILFVLVVMLLGVPFFRDHAVVATYTVAAISFLIALRVGFLALSSGEEEKKEGPAH
jgi:hypothetical protein